MLLSVIIVNWNVRDLLRDCIRSLRAHTRLPPHQWEVIVVDNASSDGSVAMLRDELADVHVIANDKNVGFGQANCQGLAHASGRAILLLNPDTIVRDDAVERLVARLDEDPRIGAIGCRLANADGSLQRWTGGHFPTLTNLFCHYFFLDRVLGPAGVMRPLYMPSEVYTPRDIDWLCGACLLLRREAIPDPLFDPRYFMYGEDLDLCYRLKGAGWRVLYDPSRTIIHYQGASISQQSGDALLSTLRGLRDFVRHTKGRGAVRFLDLVTIAGFFVRWLAYRIAGAFARADTWSRKARSSWMYASIAVRLARG